jgi:hypothetical protein
MYGAELTVQVITVPQLRTVPTHAYGITWEPIPLPLLPCPQIEPVGGHIKCCVMVHSRKARKLTGFCFLCIENDRVRSYCDHVSLSSPSSRRISSWGRASSAPLSFRKAAESGSSAQSGKGSRTR